MKKDKLVQSLLIRQTLLRKPQNDLKATQIYLIVLPIRRRKFPKKKKKKKLYFENFIFSFSAVVDLFISKKMKTVSFLLCQCNKQSLLSL